MKWYPNAAKDDVPVKHITLKDYEIDQAEVTNERYSAFVKATGHRAPYHWKHAVASSDRGNYPVTNVSWQDAADFCKWDGKRLPTEAEWERAARGNSGSAKYPWGDRPITPQDARYQQLDGPGPICQHARNDFGLCDMIGNVWEWNADWYGRSYYEVAPEIDPQGPEDGIYRVLRGGSWFDVPELFLTTSYRSWARPSERSPTIGFRCARSVK